MRTSEKVFDLHRPSLTRDEVAALQVGAKIRDIPGRLYHVIGIVSADGFGGGDVAMLAHWLKHKGWWMYQAEPFEALTILYTTE
jgi:hypothetical protein